MMSIEFNKLHLDIYPTPLPHWMQELDYFAKTTGIPTLADLWKSLIYKNDIYAPVKMGAFSLYVYRGYKNDQIFFFKLWNIDFDVIFSQVDDLFWYFEYNQ